MWIIFVANGPWIDLRMKRTSRELRTKFQRVGVNLSRRMRDFPSLVVANSAGGGKYPYDEQQRPCSHSWVKRCGYFGSVLHLFWGKYPRGEGQEGKAFH